MHVYGAAYGAGIPPVGITPGGSSAPAGTGVDAFAELLAMETAKTETAAMNAVFSTGSAKAAQPQNTSPGELTRTPAEESAEPLTPAAPDPSEAEETTEDTERTEDELTAEAAASLMTPVVIIQPQEMPEEPDIDKEASGVAAPPALKVQEELRELIARIAGVEESDGFSVFVDKLLAGQPVTYQDMADARLTLTQLGNPVSEQDIAKLIQWLQSVSVQLPDRLGLTAELPREALVPQDIVAQLLMALNAETPIVTQSSETPEPLPEIETDAAPTILPDTEIAQTETIRPAAAAQMADNDESAALSADSKPLTPELAVPAPASAAPAETAPSAKPAQPAAAADSADIIRQLTEHINLQRGESVTKLEMTLNPATLGRISIVLEQTADGLTAALKPQNESVRSLLAAHSTELQNALKDLGIRMESVSIEQPDIGWDFARGQMEQQQREAPQHGSRHRRLRTIPGADTALNPLTALMYGASALQPIAVGEASLDLRA